MTRTPLSMSKGQRSRSPGRFTHRRVNGSGSCSGERGNVLTVGNCCYVAVCSVARGASALTGGGEARGHIVATARLQLVTICDYYCCQNNMLLSLKHNFVVCIPHSIQLQLEYLHILLRFVGRKACPMNPGSPHIGFKLYTLSFNFSISSFNAVNQ